MGTTLIMGKSDLHWGIIRTTSAFTVHNGIGNGAIFTRDPFSCRGRHCFAESGLVNSSAVAITGGAGKGVQVTVKRSRRFKNNTKHGFRHYNFSTTQMRGTRAAKRFAGCPARLRKVTALHKAGTRAAARIAASSKAE